jgi:hypothetical protein
LEVLVDGEVIQPIFLHEYWKKLINECNEKLSVLWGNEGAPPSISVHQCVDSFVDQSLSKNGLNVIVKPPEGSFVSPSDYMASLNNKVFVQLQSNADLYDKEAEKWKSEGVFEWTKKADSLLELLVSLIHIGGGGAGRAPDLEALSLCNVSGAQKTMFFLARQGLCTMLTPTKTKKVRGGNLE